MASALVALVATSATMEAGAWGASGDTSSAVITFDDAAQQVQLQIPTPACPESQPTCQWKFFLNEPKLSVDVSTIYGISGTLTLAYPKDFCGVIQADAYVGPPWVAKRGWQHTIEDCNPVTSPTSGPTTTTTTDAPPDATTTTTTAVPPADAPTSVPPTPPSAAASSVPPAVDATTATSAAPPAPAATPSAVAATSAPTQLPFTGVDFGSLLLMGLLSVALGLCLLVRFRPGVHSRGRVAGRRP